MLGIPLPWNVMSKKADKSKFSEILFKSPIILPVNQLLLLLNVWNFFFVLVFEKNVDNVISAALSSSSLQLHNILV